MAAELQSTHGNAEIHVVNGGPGAAEQNPGKQPWAEELVGSMRHALLCGTIALTLFGCVEQTPVHFASDQTIPSSTAMAATALAHNKATLDFIDFALNVLLLPLLDDDLPSRWADPSLAFDCNAGQVTVDGASLDIGAPVPDGRFKVHWHMERCTPLDDYTELSGDVELMVESDHEGYKARVSPAQLHVVSAYGDEVLNEPFTASMHIGR